MGKNFENKITNLHPQERNYSLANIRNQIQSNCHIPLNPPTQNCKNSLGTSLLQNLPSSFPSTSISNHFPIILENSGSLFDSDCDPQSPSSLKRLIRIQWHFCIGYVEMYNELAQFALVLLVEMGWLCKNCNFEAPNYQPCPKCKNVQNNWFCKNEKFYVPKYQPCPKCKNVENNWACTTCHICNPKGNTMKRCGGGMNEAYWWYNPKYQPCKCGNTENCWRCYNCDFNNPKYQACKCGNVQNHWRCKNCDRDVAKYQKCKCGNNE